MERFKKSKTMIFPREIIVGHNTTSQIAELCDRIGRGKTILIVADKKTKKLSGDNISKNLTKSDYNVKVKIVSAPTIKSVNSVINFSDKQKIDILLGVGGGNFILPMLVYLGFNPKKASATTAFIVIFSSFAGFLGHASLGNIHIPLLAFAALGSVLGALLGSWLMTEKLKPKQVKITIGIVLLGIAIKMIWNLTT